MKRLYKNIFLGIAILFICFSITNVFSKTETKLHVEVPNQESVVGTPLVISGWLMTDSDNPTFHVYIDNEEIDCPINRFERDDVIMNNLHFKNNETNKVPGFNTMIDISNYKDGMHTLTINILDHVKQEVLKEFSSIFYLQKSKSVLHWEKPVHNSVVKNSLTLSGWLMSTNPNNAIEYYINREKVEIPTTRIMRPDVINGMPGYGGEKTNPTPGFSATLDTSNYSDGSYFLEMKIVDSSNNEILTGDSRYIKIEKYSSIINIDHPESNYISGTNLRIDGWILSECSTKEIEIFIDDSKIDSEIVNNSRPDVIKAMGNSYGENNINKTPGFSTIVDVSHLQDGIHTLKINIINTETNEIIKTSTKSFKTEKYSSFINIDHPKSDVRQKDTLTVDGWYLSCLKNNNLKIFIDGIEINTDIVRSKRPDVLSSMNNMYGGQETNEQPGFSISISTRNYKDGLHKVSIQVIDAENGNVIKEKETNFYLNKYDTYLNVDHPKNNVEEMMVVDGWFLSECKDATIELSFDNEIINTDIIRSQREDVLKAMNNGYGGRQINSYPGFSTTVDLTNYKNGQHLLIIQIKDSITNENIAIVEKIVYLTKYKTLINLDNPKQNSYTKSIMNVSGWEVSTATNEKVSIIIDGIVEDVEITRSPRQDVIDHVANSYGSKYGNANNNSTPGFNALVDLSDMKDGLHTIMIEVKDIITNDVIDSVSRRFNLKKYDGKIHIESPQTSMLNETSIMVAGWEMSELDNSYIELYLNGNKLDSEIVRGERSDVVQGVSGYGGVDVNQTPGFASIVDLSNYSEGKHTITIKLYSRLNELLAEESKDVFLYKGIDFGLDVSYYQGDINWQSVRNDGNSFAIIRAGFRGYGTGAIVEDVKFKDNIINALNAGVKCGVYFYTQAINENEAIQEADFVVGKLQEYGVVDKISLPIVFDTEFTEQEENGVALGRADNLSTRQRTNVAKAFLKRIEQHGFTPMIYASRDFLYFHLYMGELTKYEVWLAHYTSSTNPIGYPSNYTGVYQIWQYTSSGHVAGISGKVDRNISYKKY